MNREAKRQTLLITGINGLIRAMGFFLRVVMARMLGPEIMGIAELASGVHMLAITPLTSGLPMAVSRLTAKSDAEKAHLPLVAGLRLVRLVSLVLIPFFLLLSPVIARAMGDIRVLPSLWCTAPCVLILGYSGVYNGYCYGTKRSSIPAVSELTEQTLRLLFTLLLINTLKHLTPGWLAAVPVASTMLAEIFGLLLVICWLRLPAGYSGAADVWRKPIIRLALPTTTTRLIHTLLRSVTSMMIPLRLTASGLPASEATARLGMLNGMVLPMMMLPCIFTGALNMVMAPRLAQSEENARSCKALLSKVLVTGLLVALLCSGILALLSPFIANIIYRLPELTDILYAAIPLCFLCAAENLTVGTITSLGLQKQAMYGALPSSLLSLLLTWVLTAMPHYRLEGVIVGLAAGHMTGILWNSWVIFRWWQAHT